MNQRLQEKTNGYDINSLAYTLLRLDAFTADSGATIYLVAFYRATMSSKETFSKDNYRYYKTLTNAKKFYNKLEARVQ